MAKLIYFLLASLDGLIAGENDNMNWSSPTEEVSAFINERHRPIGTYLYGRKQYETMKVWETPDVIPGLAPVMLDFARIWQAAGKIVYSKSLAAGLTARTRFEQEFEPQAVRDLKAQLPHDMTIGGPNLAAQAMQAGLVDEYELIIVPFLLGRGIQVLPGGATVGLELLDERHFGNGWVYLHYRTRA